MDSRSRISVRQRLSRSRGELLASIERTPRWSDRKAELAQFAGDQDLSECRSIVESSTNSTLNRRIGGATARRAMVYKRLVADFHIIFRHGRGLSRPSTWFSAWTQPKCLARRGAGKACSNRRPQCGWTTWMAGTSPAMTRGGEMSRRPFPPAIFNPHKSAQPNTACPPARGGFLPRERFRTPVARRPRRARAGCRRPKPSLTP